MKQIIDHQTGKTVSIGIVGNVLQMTCNGTWVDTCVHGEDLIAAKVAMSKRDLESFGALFNAG